MTSRYASLLFGTTSYKQIGPFRFPVYGELGPGEAKELADITKAQSTNSFRSLKLARKLAKDRGITTKKAIELLSNLEDDANEDIVFEYAEDLAGAQEGQLTDEALDTAYATITLKYRGQAEIDGSWTDLKDWTEADTDAIPSMSLIQEIAAFIRAERGDKPKAAEGNDPSPKK